LINKETAEKFGLDSDEWSRILERLGRAPNRIEAEIFATLWSEEVGFRNSSSMLNIIEKDKERIDPIPGMFGGALAIDDSLQLVARAIHNNPGFRNDPTNGLPTAVAAGMLSIAAQGAK